MVGLVPYLPSSTRVLIVAHLRRSFRRSERIRSAEVAGCRKVGEPSEDLQDMAPKTPEVNAAFFCGKCGKWPKNARIPLAFPVEFPGIPASQALESVERAVSHQPRFVAPSWVAQPRDPPPKKNRKELLRFEQSPPSILTSLQP